MQQKNAENAVMVYSKTYCPCECAEQLPADAVLLFLARPADDAVLPFLQVVLMMPCCCSWHVLLLMPCCCRHPQTARR